MPKKSVLPVVTATVNFVADDTRVVLGILEVSTFFVMLKFGFLLIKIHAYGVLFNTFQSKKTIIRETGCNLS